MVRIVKYRAFYFLFSLLVIVPGLLAVIFWHINFGIDFTGGTLANFSVEGEPSTQDLSQLVKLGGFPVESVQTAGSKTYIIRLQPQSQEQVNKMKEVVGQKYGKVEELSLETVGPTISGEITRNALKAVVLACLAIVIYITWAFRQVPKPASSLSFGVAAIVALVHDILVVVGVFAILGRLLGVQVDSLFVTALLTVLGFSVHDTIVVFDRIRENLRKFPDQSFEQVVDRSIVQTLGRSLSTSLTVVFVLFALILFGGASIKWFVVALLVGIVSGTYSSIFNAAPLLVVWQNFKTSRKA